MRPQSVLVAATPAFRDRVAESIKVIEEAATRGRVGVAFSGGKDSTALLHLVRSVIPDAPAALYDSGVEMPETLDLARHYGAQIIQPRLNFLDVARYNGAWGHADPVDASCNFNLQLLLIDEPGEAFVVRNRLTVCALGLRAQESRARERNAAARGMLYQGDDRTWYLCPLQNWSTADVWAYIDTYRLRYHPVYDAMQRLGLPADQQRLGMSMGTIAVAQGRMAVMRRCAPAHFARLVADFPGLLDVS